MSDVGHVLSTLLPLYPTFCMEGVSDAGYLMYRNHEAAQRT